MRVLLTGGTGVIGEGVVAALLRSKHRVRLLSRGAEGDADEWPKGVEPFAADVTDAESLEGAADGCDVCVHVTGVVEESPPEVTFERVNVEGTRNVMREAERARVARFVYVSSLGADRGRSDYHRSKLAAERVVRDFNGEWVILRPGGVYGPGDEVISTLLKMVRALPVVPVVGGGEQKFQPVWYEDFGETVARAVEAEEAAGRVLEVAGGEVTTTDDVLDRLSKITGRNPTRLPVPSFLASLGVQVAGLGSLGARLSEWLGVGLPVNDAKLKMLLEENVIREPGANALTEVFGILPTPLDDGLRMLADSVPEILPSEGTGGLERKRFWADIEGSDYAAAALLKLFRERCVEVMPVEFEAEPGAERVVKRGATLTAALPLRGNIQVKVVEANDRRVTFATVEGHPLAGVVQFAASRQGRGIRFLVEVHARAANAFDWLGMKTVGAPAQDRNWEQVVERVVALSGGHAPAGVRRETVTLDEDEAARAESEIEKLVRGNRRAQKSRRVKRAATDSTRPRKGHKASDAERPRADDAATASSADNAAETLRGVGRTLTAAAGEVLATVNAAVKGEGQTSD